MALPPVSPANPLAEMLYEPFHSGVIPNLNARGLIALKRASHCFYQIVHRDPSTKKVLDYPENIYLWGPKQMVYLNPQLHIASDFEIRTQCNHPHSFFSLGTLLTVADWLRNYGKERKIPACGLQYYHPREIYPLDYVDAIFDVQQRDPCRPNATNIFYHLCRSLQALEVPDPLEHGGKAFFDEGGYSSTDQQKADALERYVADCFLEKPLNELNLEEERDDNVEGD
jgi:hypothetical protein